MEIFANKRLCVQCSIQWHPHIGTSYKYTCFTSRKFQNIPSLHVEDIKQKSILLHPTIYFPSPPLPLLIIHPNTFRSLVYIFPPFLFSATRNVQEKLNPRQARENFYTEAMLQRWNCISKPVIRFYYVASSIVLPVACMLLLAEASCWYKVISLRKWRENEHLVAICRQDRFSHIL